MRWTTPSGVIDVKAGEGAGLPQLPVTETNPGSVATLWYAFAIAETGLESTTLATMRRLAVGPRLPLPQPEGSYTIRLDLITLEGGGRTASQSHGGAALIFVLDGRSRSAPRTAVMISAAPKRAAALHRARRCRF